MRTLCFLFVLHAAVVPVFAQLSAPTDYQLADYCPWLGRLDPTRNTIVPSAHLPASTPIYKHGIRRWTTWRESGTPSINWDQPESGSIQTEIVFIGQTGHEWGRFGYTLNNLEYLLSESAADRQFGSNFTAVNPAPLAMEFFVEDRNGVRYSAATAAFYRGERQPISSIHDQFPDERLYTMNPYYVFAIEIPSVDSESSQSLFIFGVNAFDQHLLPVPEPSTYGLAAAAALLLLSWRRSRSEHRRGVAL